MIDIQQKEDGKQKTETPHTLIEKCSNEMLAKVLRTEDPHTGALIIGRLPLEKKAAVLEGVLPHLTADQQKIILTELTFGTSELAESMQLIEADIAEKIKRLTEKRTILIGGIDFVNKILINVNELSKKEILTLLKNANPALYEQVHAEPFVFEDIVMLDDRSIQKTMHKTDTAQTAAALATASCEVKHKIMINLSKHTTEKVEEEIKTIHAKLEEDTETEDEYETFSMKMENAQAAILDTIFRLEKTGEIVLPKPEFDFMEEAGNIIFRKPPLEFISKPLSDFIENCDTATLCAVLQQEDQLIIPLLIGTMSLHKAAELLQMLPDSVRLPIIEYLAQGNFESADAVECIAEHIRNEIEQNTQVPYIELDGIDFLEKMIGLTDSLFTKNVLSFLEKTNYEAYTALRERIFLFEDIALLHNHSIIKLLREIDKEDFLRAFSAPCPAVQEKMERNMSKEAAAALKEELDYMGPVPIQKVRESRQKIIEQLRQLVERGEIVLQYTDAEKFLMQKKTIFKATAPGKI